MTRIIASLCLGTLLLVGCTGAEADRSVAEMVEESEQPAMGGCCAGPWQLIDGSVSITDLTAFSTFTTTNGYPLHPTGGEIMQAPQYYIGITGAGGTSHTIVDQYIKYKYPTVTYCEYFTVFKDSYCPPRGGVLFIQGSSQQPGEPAGYLRSENDTNCNYNSACPNVTPGACWANIFHQSIVKEIWIR